jgi:hypothetical protein
MSEFQVSRINCQSPFTRRYTDRYLPLSIVDPDPFVTEKMPLSQPRSPETPRPVISSVLKVSPAAFDF